MKKYEKKYEKNMKKKYDPFLITYCSCGQTHTSIEWRIINSIPDGYL